MGDLAWNDTSKTWELDDFDTFSDEEKETIELPDGGMWLKVIWYKEAEAWKVFWYKEAEA
jgi:hypothetical protein